MRRCCREQRHGRRDGDMNARRADIVDYCCSMGETPDTSGTDDDSCNHDLGDASASGKDMADDVEGLKTLGETKAAYRGASTRRETNHAPIGRECDSPNTGRPGKRPRRPPSKGDASLRGAGPSRTDCLGVTLRLSNIGLDDETLYEVIAGLDR